MPLSFFVSSDLYCAGYTEDGDQFAAERYYVMAETSEGRRFKHVKHFDGTNPTFDEDDEGFGHTVFPDLREEASNKATILLDQIESHMNSGGRLDRALWVEVNPRYGSEAYQNATVEDLNTYFIVKQEF
jgi:hypothetical protein